MEKRGLLIGVEGTDACGKELQSKMLVKRLNLEGYSTKMINFPRYDTPTGKIIGGPYLGKKNICESWFPEGANDVPKEIASLYYAGDRAYARPFVNKTLESGDNLVTDRWTESNKGHQGGKIRDAVKRKEFYKKLDWLEHDFLELPKLDLTIFLYMPYSVSSFLKSKMDEEKDGHENNPDHMKNAEEAYLQLANLYNWNKIACAPDGTVNSLRTPKDIHDEVYSIVIEKINRNL